MLFAPHDGSHRRKDLGSRSVEASLRQAQEISHSSSATAAKRPAKRHGCLDAQQGKQQVNLFWDHWRLRQFQVERSTATVVEMEKEAARGGRSYGDAECIETGDTQPSHLLISLP